MMSSSTVWSLRIGPTPFRRSARRGSVQYRVNMSAAESATNLGNICCETIYERLGVHPGCALTFGHRLGQEFADQLGDGHTALSCHGIKGDRHGAVDAYREVALTAFGRLLFGDVRDALAGLLLQ